MEALEETLVFVTGGGGFLRSDDGSLTSQWGRIFSPLDGGTGVEGTSSFS